jgi:quinol monooxygenase YgiN
MLVIAGTITLDPADREKAIAAAVDMMEATRKETGCVAYTFSGDFSDPAIIHLFEQWESQEALNAHFQAPHMATFQAALGGLSVKNMAVQKYEISAVGPVR